MSKRLRQVSQRLCCNILLYKSREKVRTVLTILLFIKFKNIIYINQYGRLRISVIYYNLGTLMERINYNFFIRSVTIIIEYLFSSNRVIKFYNDIFNSVQYRYYSLYRYSLYLLTITWQTTVS